MQAILLSALAGFYLYTTETRPRPVGCLIIATTNRGPQGVKADLRYRFGGQIVAPSLADRLGDVALIAIHLLVRWCAPTPTTGGC